MTLYQIFYRGSAFDADAPLPSRPPADTLYAVRTTGAPEYLVPGRSGAWVLGTKASALARK